MGKLLFGMHGIGQRDFVMSSLFDLFLKLGIDVLVLSQELFDSYLQT